MKFIALDQNGISNLAFPPSVVWSEILDLLCVGVAKGALLCPTSTVTLSESVHLDRGRRDAVEQLCSHLSGGYFFRFPWEMIALEALAKVRPGLDTFPLWIPPEVRRLGEPHYTAASLQILNERADFENAVNPVAANVRSVLGPCAFKQFSARSNAYQSAVEWLRTVRGHLNKLRNGQTIGDDQFMIQQICGTLVALKVTDKEITGLLRSIQRGQWLEIPVLACWFAIDGVFIYDQLNRRRRIEYNDEWDKYRAGEAYQCAHCFITDRGMAAALRQAKLPHSDYFEVFSVIDTTRIVAYLKAAVG